MHKLWSKLGLTAGRAVLVAAAAYAGLELHEGVGDNVTEVKTGSLGVTQGAKDSVEGSESLSDQEVANRYMLVLYSKWKRVEGFTEAPPRVQEALLDMSYNLGESSLRYKGIVKALSMRDWHQALIETLDTASVDGKALRGIAKRRAYKYNKAVSTKITSVEQLRDGTLIYYKGEEVFFKYRSKRGRHEKSGVGLIPVS